MFVTIKILYKIAINSSYIILSSDNLLCLSTGLFQLRAYFHNSDKALHTTWFSSTFQPNAEVNVALSDNAHPSSLNEIFIAIASAIVARGRYEFRSDVAVQCCTSMLQLAMVFVASWLNTLPGLEECLFFCSGLIINSIKMALKTLRFYINDNFKVEII